jgi:hypothetical protein
MPLDDSRAKMAQAVLRAKWVCDAIGVRRSGKMAVSFALPSS